MARSSHLGIDEGRKNLEDSRALDQLAGQIEIGAAGRSAPTGIEGRAPQRTAPRSRRLASGSEMGGTWSSRSESTVTP